MRFQQDLEVARRLEGMESRDQRSIGLVVEPLADELIELFLLRQPLQQILLVVQANGRRRAPAVHEQVRLAVGAKSRDRLFELVLGAGLVARSVRARELGRKRRAETRPENGDDDVGVGWLDDLGLKGRGGEQRLVLPENRLEHDLADVLALQSLDDTPGQRALFKDIAG